MIVHLLSLILYFLRLLSDKYMLRIIIFVNIIMCMLIKPKYLTISLKIDNKQHQECQRINPASSTYSL